MQKRVLTIAIILFTAVLTVSCNKCKEKTGEYKNDKPESVVQDSTSNAAAGNSTTSEGKGKVSGTTENGTAAGGKKGNSGYSAPDGTNAENNDGDMYTKNDTTPMPSGPPIK